ncbi:tRNA lysidine(34) synthetase TilS [Rhodalgimonas zhirmunskyi]|uniref:tRNA(Ile)-lysidine synthase n=1 Tax=Rhodalgimonas zhirmunskyi TaxID=2964767 RepID=A0AAJ1UC03_9RHOB|nr:tRNA lysidine(34) synthetase TilS [Rhodoalgimonas zhirmunskyi]MDQ2095083.1 tRNA lysidine(34) synthetase TilS [Rhodoalgimonas zhirmunskyi]
MSETPDAFLYNIVSWPFVNTKAEKIAVAVSGGSDSMALLLLMQHWAQERGAELCAVTLDHGLRPEAAEEAVMVGRVCAERGISHETLSWQWDKRGNLQAAAREARYRLIADWALAKGVDAVCLGHTRDDQAETFLMRLARKSGSDGLKSMPEQFDRFGMRFARPVLGVHRADLQAFLAREDVGWVDDPSNADETYDRVRARKALAALRPLGIDAEGLATVAHNLAMENALVRQAVRDALAGKVTEQHGALSIALRDFRLQWPETRRRFLQAAIGWLSGADYVPRALAVSHLEFALSGKRAHTLGGVIGWVAKDRIWLAREPRAVEGLRGTPFDARWKIEGPLEGLEIRALGEEGLKQWPEWRAIGLPRRVWLSLPGVWNGAELVATPHDDAENRYKASLMTTSFDNWLARH